ncbi:MAG: DUF1015 domain-containing protein [Spirochaetales bacterium]
MPISHEHAKTFSRFALAAPRVCLPSPGVDLNRWAVLACDQHTSEPEYWRDVARYVGSDPSTLHLILPEVHLEAPDVNDRIERAQATMRQYIEEGILVEYDPMFTLVRRHLSDGTRRDGLLAAVDLEQYDYRPESRAPVRATEKTIESRIPARTRIRRGAAVEVPHILVLVDDPEDLLLGPLVRDHERMKRLYSTPLMYHGGHVEGYRVDDDAHIETMLEALETLACPGRMRERYGTDDIFLFPVGDGNHSLAAAKHYWEERKDAGAHPDDPARFAMVELVNLHRDGLPFHPIHRAVSGVTETRLHESLSAAGFSLRGEASAAADNGSADRPISNHVGTRADITVHSTSGRREYLQADRSSLSVALVDDVLQNIEGAQVDYIHGAEAIERTVERGGLAVELPPLDRDSLLPTVVRYGTLPRKAFSLGRPMDKRYYLEARRLER